MEASDIMGRKADNVTNTASSVLNGNGFKFKKTNSRNISYYVGRPDCARALSGAGVEIEIKQRLRIVSLQNRVDLEGSFETLHAPKHDQQMRESGLQAALVH